MSRTSRRPRPVLAATLSLSVLASLVILDQLFWKHVLHQSFGLLWLNQGPLLGLTATLISVIWRDLDRHNRGLISAHPVLYLAEGIVLLAGFFNAVSNSIPLSTEVKERSPTLSLYEWVPNALIGMAVLSVMSIVAIAWFLAVMPTMYFVTLIAGAPARMALLTGLPRRPLGTSSFRLTLATRPVTATAAFAAALLWLLKAIALWP